MSKRTPELLIEDICESISRIAKYTRNISQSQFEKDTKTFDAVVRNLEIIGEAANRLPEKFKGAWTEIEWHKITGLRHRIVHDYFGLDSQIIWQIIVRDIPVFGKALRRLKSRLKRN